MVLFLGEKQVRFLWYGIYKDSIKEDHVISGALQMNVSFWIRIV